MPEELTPGAYDDLVDLLLRNQLDALDEGDLRATLSAVDAADVPHRIGEAVLQDIAPGTTLPEDRLAPPLERLTAIETVAHGSGKISHPLTPLRDTVLMTNARGEPGVGREIRAEIHSADRIDLVCAFIRWTGIRELLPDLRRHVEAGKALRIITTTYTRSTEPRALDALQALGGQVRVSYDNTNTRLHAKAWLFHRKNGHSTVYIGSSNLTFSAQVTGLEWNVRASRDRNPDLVDKFEATFASYWANPKFEPYDPGVFEAAIGRDGDSIDLSPFDVRPYPFQSQILEKLEVDRNRGYPHNLVVAATGTGKTVVAGLDYSRLRARLPSARLLYVAHRREILERSRTIFRHILRDGAFGELWLAGREPARWDHVFASIQTLVSRDVSALAPDPFDVVIVDEFHHAAATTYERFLDHIKPRHLLGLTATPERMDNLDILRWFEGRTSYELRLWDALEQELLCPFHYFGIHDETNLSGVTWRGGTGYDHTELTNVYTADDFWIGKVLQAVNDKVGTPGRMRALGFCVSIEHARFCARTFESAGLNAVAVTSETASEERAGALRQLADGDIQVIFTVDLFNEGVDVPEIDVVLMLRPTHSATVFLQQLGRGLRRDAGKDVLTVLDFVGHQRKEFRFDQRYRRMLGRSRTELISDIEEGFPYLPAGCHLELDPVATDIVLENVRHGLPSNFPQRARELRDLGDVPLGTYLAKTGLDLDDVYRSHHYWTKLRRAAGFLDGDVRSGEDRIGRGLGRLQHVDDIDRLTFLKRIVERTPPDAGSLTERERRQLSMAMLTILNPGQDEYGTLQDAVDALWRYPELVEEWRQLLALMDGQIVHLHEDLDADTANPLQTHAHYRQEEILGAFGASTPSAPLFIREGVYWHAPTQTDLLFVTLQKSEKDFSPQTRYRDYAISEELFHWESQANTTVRSEVGQRYLHHRSRGSRVVLFIRTSKQDANRRTLPYFCAGYANYVSHESERPIAITWALEKPLPGDLFVEYRAAVA